MRRALVLLAVPVVLAACGGGGFALRGVTPAAQVRKAANVTAATSEHIALKVSLSFGGRVISVTGAGDYDSVKRQGTFRVVLPFGPTDEVVDDTTIYLRSALVAGVLPGGKTWLKVDLQKALASKGVDVAALLSQNPAQALAQLKALGRVEKIGDATVDGVATTHYRGRIDVTKLPHGAKIRALTRARYGPYDVWIGKDDGYVRRVSFVYAAAPGSALAARVGVTMKFSEFGKAVNVTVPPDSETFDATEAPILGPGG